MLTHMKNNRTCSNQVVRGAPRLGEWPAPIQVAARTVCLLLLAVGACLMADAVAQAATVTWTGASGTDTNWSTAGNWDIGVPGPADDAVFSAAGVVYDASINNYVDASTLVGSLSYTQTGASTYQNTFIGDAQTLSIYLTAATNAVFVGSGTDLGSIDSLATISGPNGALAVTASNGVFNVRQGGLGHYSGTASLDMAGLSNATITVHNLLVAGDGSNALDDSGGRPADRASGILNLAQYSTVNILGTTPVYGQPGMTLGFINGNGGAGGHLALGLTNYIYCDSGLAVGLNRAGSATAPCTLNFNPSFVGQSPYVLFRNLAGTGRQSKWLIGDASWLPYTGNSTAGTVDFSNGMLDAQVDQLVVGRSLPSGSGGPGTASTGILTFDTGTLDVNSLTIGYMLADYCPMVAGTVNVNGTAQLKVNTSMQLGYFRGEDPAPNSTNGVSFAKLNIGGGSVSVNGPITTTQSALNDFNDSEINLNAGSLYVKGTVGPLYQFTLGSGTTNTFDLGTTPNPSAPICSVTNLTTSPSATLIVLGSALGNGTIRVIKYQNWVSGSFSDLVGVPPARYQGYFTNNTANLSIDFVITNTVADVWNGQTNRVNIGNWDINITPNWKNGALPHTYLDGDIAVFDDTAAGTTTVNLATVVSPATVYVNITNKNYTLGGSGQLSGTASLTKNGGGTLTLGNTGANIFSGAVLINAGTVQISGSADRLPTNAAVTLANASGAILDLNGQNQTIGSLAGGGTTGGEVKLGTGQLTVRTLSSATYNGLLTGTGSLMVSNTTSSPGLNLVLTRDNTFSGGTVITNAAVIVANSAASARTPLGTGPIIIKGTSPNPGSTTVGLWLGNGAGTVGYVSQAFITNGQTVAFKNGLDMDFTNCIVGSAGIYVAPVGNAPNGARLTISGTNLFTGRVQIDSGELRITTSQPWGNSSSATAIVLGNLAQLELANNITNTRPVSQAGPGGTENSTGVGIVNVSGTNTMAGLITGISGGSSWAYRSDAGKIIFRGNWTNTTLTGTRHIWLRGAGDGEWVGGIGSIPTAVSSLFCTNNLIKDGAGTWTLSGNNSYNGYTGISNGTFVVNGTHLVKNASGDTNVYVASGATLRGTGRIISPPVVMILAGGTLAPGTPAAMGSLTISNTLSMVATTSTSVFRVSNTGIPANDQVRGLAKVNYAGTLKVTLLPGTLVGGEIFKVFDAAAYSATGFDAYDLPSIPSPLSWDTSQLTVDGTLRVNGAVANKNVAVTAVGRAPDGNFQMSGGSVLTNWNYRVLASTNVADPLITWPQVGSGSLAGGVFSFIDLNSTNYPQRFYRVVAP